MAKRIEAEILAARMRTRTIGAALATVCLVLIVAVFVLGLTKSVAAGVAAVAITCAFIALCASAAMAVRSNVVLRVGTANGWQLMPCEAQETGHGHALRVEIVVERFVRLRPWDGLSNSRKLLGVTEIELAGEVSGKALVRIPGTARIYIYRRLV